MNMRHRLIEWIWRLKAGARKQKAQLLMGAFVLAAFAFLQAIGRGEGAVDPCPAFVGCVVPS